MTDDRHERLNRRLVDLDWLDTLRGDRLHHASLSPEDAELLEDWGSLGIESKRGEPILLDCGRRVEQVSIPGIISRMSVPRCTRCCRATGLPEGAGSPKNSSDCRKILKLNEETP